MSEQNTIEAEPIPETKVLETKLLEQIIEYLLSKPCGETRVLVNQIEWSLHMHNKSEPNKEE